MSLCLNGSTQCLRLRKKKQGRTYTTPSLKVGSRAPFLPLLLTYGFTYFWNYLLYSDLLQRYSEVWNYLLLELPTLFRPTFNDVLTYGFTYFQNYLLYSDLLLTMF